MKRTLLFTVSILALVVLLTLPSDSGAVGPSGVLPLPPVNHTDGRAGLCYSFYPDGETDRAFMTLAHQAGSRWDRFDFVWPRLEPENGHWDYGDDGAFADYDTLVDDLTTVGIDIVGILLWTPEWAASGDVSALAAAGPPERPAGWYEPVPRSQDMVEPLTFPSVWASPPRNLYEPWYSGWMGGHEGPTNYWGRFVYTVVERYGDQVKHWEMWNEPEWNVFWTGSSGDYAQLLKIGYQATKAACADCQVLFGGLHYWINTEYYKWVLNALAEDPEGPANNLFFDVMSLHLYSRSSTAYDVVNGIRGAMHARGAHHPIWITETGVPLWGDADPNYRDKYDYAATPDEAGAYAIQSYANAWASGVERYFFFRTHDGDMPDLYGEYFGMIRNDRSLRPAYVAYQVATSHLISPTMVTNWTYGSGVRRVTLWGTPQGKVSVLWNSTPDELAFDYAATLPAARLVDRHGNEQVIGAAEGVFGLSLPGATANLVSHPHDYFIGGDPYLVIEEDTVPPSKAVVDPLPATTVTRTVMIEASAVDEVSGIWGYELGVQKDGGSWKKWGQLHPAPITYTGGEHGGGYCFRVRAWDRVGNPGPWSDQERCTTLDWTRELHVDIPLVFGDRDGDGQRGDDDPILDEVTFRLVNRTNHEVVAEAIGPSWTFTKPDALLGERYLLMVIPPDWPSLPNGWLPRGFVLPIEGYGRIEILGEIGLPNHKTRMLLPIITSSR